MGLGQKSLFGVSLFKVWIGSGVPRRLRFLVEFSCLVAQILDTTFNDSCSSGFEARKAGIKPNKIPMSTDTASVNSSGRNVAHWNSNARCPGHGVDGGAVRAWFRSWSFARCRRSFNRHRSIKASLVWWWSALRLAG